MKIGLIQFSGLVDKAANLEVATRLADAAVADGAEIICFHELVSTIYFPFEESSEYFQLAEPVPGPTTDYLSQYAAERGVAVIAPLFERVGGTSYYNSAVVIAAGGGIVGTYRKNTIPLIRRDGSPGTGFEKYYFKPGDNGFPVFQLDNGCRIGVLICFDRHFPEHFRALAMRGADIIFIPTTAPKSNSASWRFELQAGAFANGCWVAGVGRVGRDESGADRSWLGESILVDPRGDVLAVASDREEESLVADVDLGAVPRAQAQWGFFRDRRPELYTEGWTG